MGIDAVFLVIAEVAFLQVMFLFPRLAASLKISSTDCVCFPHVIATVDTVCELDFPSFQTHALLFHMTVIG